MFLKHVPSPSVPAWPEGARAGSGQCPGVCADVSKPRLSPPDHGSGFAFRIIVAARCGRSTLPWLLVCLSLRKGTASASQGLDPTSAPHLLCCPPVEEQFRGLLSCARGLPGVEEAAR
ncbi:hypothetical protein J1605_013019 [Eschrichtius robustus]|uniref:Uncharacterized protein n=1 Tax=Eschrichtius robustus TaxID=9764 RepID=A0AB34GJA4_ESCRO|nr:hypothetical protein J1605_013019 [Eschrichtius robustus]